DDQGNPVSIPGSLKEVKGIGWYIEEYGVAQLSLNLTNISITPVHVAFDEAVNKAAARGIRVTGSELVGLVPLQSMLDAGQYFLQKQQRSVGVSEAELIKIAVKSMGLDDLKPFNPEEKIIEYMLRDTEAQPLINMKLNDFADETASESPAPGGGSISAYVGVLGVSLGTMVANLSAHKRGWDDRWEEFSAWAEKGMEYQQTLMQLVDEDTASFNKIMDAFGLPKGSDEEAAARQQAIQNATKYATEVPFKVLDISYKSMEVMKAMAEFGNPNSVTDAGVGALCARTAVRGALLNVKINAAGLDDKKFASEIVMKGETIADKAFALENEIMDVVDSKI
ncbi:MAG: cyclodeaminase/cyclohydrolase family protein, partial [Bacteroidota bacterium]